MVADAVLFNHVSQALPSSRRVVLAYSGGLDSHVLLSLLVSMRDRHDLASLRAVHVNHHLQPSADAFQAHCETQCQRFGVPLHVCHVAVTIAAGDSVEQQARIARYDALTAQLLNDECLLTAHHLDDQAETILLQLMRGSGVAGLAAMPVAKTWHGKTVCRPLLPVSRADLVSYANAHQLSWVDDITNQDERFDRNYLRHQVMPTLLQRWPQAATTLARSASHCAEANTLITDEARSRMQALLGSQDELLITNFSALSDVWQRTILRQWLSHCGAPIPETKQLHGMICDVVEASQDASPCFCWQGHELRRYAGALYAMPILPPHDATRSKLWDMRQDLTLTDEITLFAKDPYVTRVAQYCQGNSIEVRFRQGGERLKLKDHDHHQTLKQLWQLWRVPPWQRDRIPLLFYQGELVAVVGYALSACIDS